MADPETNLWDLLPLITPLMADCPENVQKQALRVVACQFLVQTEAWAETLTGTSADEYAIELAGEYDARLCRVLYVKVDGTEVPFACDRDGNVTFPSGVTEGLPLVAEAIWVPNLSCANYPQWILDEFGYGIAQGAVAKLTGNYRAPWRDKDTFQLATAEYRDAVGRAIRDKNRKNLGGSFSLPIPRIT